MVPARVRSSVDGFNVELFEHVYREYKLLAYVEQPGLLQNLLDRRTASVAVSVAAPGVSIAAADLEHDLEMASLHGGDERRRSTRGITHSIPSFVGAAVFWRPFLFCPCIPTQGAPPCAFPPTVSARSIAPSASINGRSLYNENKPLPPSIPDHSYTAVKFVPPSCL